MNANQQYKSNNKNLSNVNVNQLVEKDQQKEFLQVSTQHKSTSNVLSSPTREHHPHQSHSNQKQRCTSKNNKSHSKQQSPNPYSTDSKQKTQNNQSNNHKNKSDSKIMRQLNEEEADDDIQDYSKQQQEEVEYKVIKELGQGAQGAVYLIKDIKTGKKYAAKIYQKSDRHKLEEEILRKVTKLEGFPHLRDVTLIEDHHMIVMQCLGQNLRSLKESQKSQKLSIQTSLQVMHQMLMRLESLHKLGYVHCDLKPDNILIGTDPAVDHNIYLIDFGLAHYYLTPRGRHIAPPKKASFKGSISYCSLNVLNKQHPSRRDDLESMLYVILFLLNGQLPWHEGAQLLRGQDRINFVIKMKLEIGILEYGSIVPKSIIKCFKYIRSLSFETEPDYNRLKYYVKKDLENMGHSINGMYDWTQAQDQFLLPSSQQSQSEMMSPGEAIHKSIYERSYQRLSVENVSMDVDYKDLTSLELEENISVVTIKESSPNRNNLTSISPTSKKSSTGDGSDSSYMLNKNSGSYVSAVNNQQTNQQFFSHERHDLGQEQQPKSQNFGNTKQQTKPQLTFKHRSFNMFECPGLEEDLNREKSHQNKRFGNQEEQKQQLMHSDSNIKPQLSDIFNTNSPLEKIEKFREFEPEPKNKRQTYIENEQHFRQALINNQLNDDENNDNFQNDDIDEFFNQNEIEVKAKRNFSCKMSSTLLEQVKSINRRESEKDQRPQKNLGDSQ
eukprot:403364357